MYSTPSHGPHPPAGPRSRRVGLYGVIADGVTLRTRKFSVRIAADERP
jgi:hypothetical protein